MKASRKSSGAAAELRRRSEGRNGSTGRRSIEWDHDQRKMKHREAAEALPRSLKEIKETFGDEYEELKLVEEEEQDMKMIACSRQRGRCAASAADLLSVAD